MIQTIEGRIGGGKTYLAASWVCNHIARGGVVASNINFKLEPFEDQYGKKKGLREILEKKYSYVLKDSQLIFLSDSDLVKYDTGKKVIELNSIVSFYKLVPRGTPKQPVLVVIDEAHIHFPQDGYRSIPKEVLHFLTLSRHASVDVVFISQHIKNMWCQMLRLAQFRWTVRDMKEYGIPCGLFNFPWPFPHYLQLKYDYDGTTVMARSFDWARKHLYEVYKSPELASGFESMPVAGSVDIEMRGLSMIEKMKFLFFGLVLGVGVFAIGNKFFSSSDSVVSESVAEVVVPVVSENSQLCSQSTGVNVPVVSDDPERVVMFGSGSSGVRMVTVQGEMIRTYKIGFDCRFGRVVSLFENGISVSSGDSVTKIFFDS